MLYFLYTYKKSVKSNVELHRVDCFYYVVQKSGFKSKCIFKVGICRFPLKNLHDFFIEVKQYFLNKYSTLQKTYKELFIGAALFYNLYITC